MSKSTYKQQLEKLAELELKVQKSRQELANKIGAYVLKEYAHITTLNDFKKLISELKNHQHN